MVATHAVNRKTNRGSHWKLAMKKGRCEKLNKP